MRVTPTNSNSFLNGHHAFSLTLHCLQSKQQHELLLKHKKANATLLLEALQSHFESSPNFIPWLKEGHEHHPYLLPLHHFLSVSPLASCSPATEASLISLDTSNTFPLGALLHWLFLLSGHTLPLDGHMLPSHFCSNVPHSENPSLTSHLIINLKHSLSPYQAFFFFMAVTTADPAFCRNCKFAYNMSVPVIK